jgi:hypothetical protein
MFASLFSDEEFVRANTALHIDLIRDYKPDVVVDSFGVFACLAARICKVPLATVNQGNFHPASDGFLFWKGERPRNLPSAAPFFNTVAAEYGIGPFARSIDLLAGDLSLIVGTPETDPVSPTAGVTHIGPIIWQRGNAELPAEIASLNSGKPIVWVIPAIRATRPCRPHATPSSLFAPPSRPLPTRPSKWSSPPATRRYPRRSARFLRIFTTPPTCRAAPWPSAAS